MSNIAKAVTDMVQTDASRSRAAAEVERLEKQVRARQAVPYWPRDQALEKALAAAKFELVQKTAALEQSKTDFDRLSKLAKSRRIR